jgi:intron-binding protein aquarius
VRLGVPAVQLDRQGRARAEIAALYSWRYTKQGHDGLGNLPFIKNFEGEYGRANAGFLHNYQLINVPAFNGKGEHCPVPHFYQNLGEAEYVVAVFQYMRLLGYPAHSISIVTSYNGQKNLIRDVLAQRCKNPVFGYPAAVTTVDKYQGQQNDYVLLSLVRTESVGHLRDVRRLVVALSRARLGLYIFCRKALFENCYELAPAFGQLCARPSQLQLVAGEGFPTARETSEKGPSAGGVHTVSDVTEMGVLVYQMVQQAQHTTELTSTAAAAATAATAAQDASATDSVTTDSIMDVVAE